MAQATPWTPEEEAAALEHQSYASFSTLFPNRTYGAYHVKKCMLKKALRANPVLTDEQPVADTTIPEEGWEELFDSLERAESARQFLSPTQESVHRFFARGPIALAFMGDIHAGAGGVDYARFRRDLDVIRETDGLYFISNGDQLENANPKMKSGNALYHAAFSSPREQLHYIKTRFWPVKDKLLCITQGNHEARDGQMAGIDRLPGLANDLGVSYFTERGGTIHLTVGDQRYTIIAKHSYMGNSKITATNSARRLWVEWPHSWESADVIALAHFHDPHVYQHEVRGRDVVWLRNGSYKIKDEWSESKGYRPAYGVPIVIFYPDTHKMVAFKDFDDGVRFFRAIRANCEEAAA